MIWNKVWMMRYFYLLSTDLDHALRWFDKSDCTRFIFPFSLSFEHFSINEAIQCTEVYEYAMSLGNPLFCLHTFQSYKLIYAARLAEMGMAEEVGHAIWWHTSGSTLVQVMACCLTAPSHYLNQCWLIISKVQWQSLECNFRGDSSAIKY